MDLDVAAPRVQCDWPAGIQRPRCQTNGIGTTWLTGISHHQGIWSYGCTVDFQRAGDRRGRRDGGVVDSDTLYTSLKMVFGAVIHIVEVPKGRPVLLSPCDEPESLALVVQHEHPAACDLTLAASSRRRFRTRHAGMRRSDYDLIVVRQVNLKAIYNDIPDGRGCGGGGDFIHTQH